MNDPHVRMRILVVEDNPPIRLLLRHLLYVYVAFERRDDACVMYQALLAVDEEPEWDPDLVSPRILDTIRACPATAER